MDRVDANSVVAGLAAPRGHTATSLGEISHGEFDITHRIGYSDEDCLGFPPVDYDNYLLWLEQSHYSVSSVGPAESFLSYSSHPSIPSVGLNFPLTDEMDLNLLFERDAVSSSNEPCPSQVSDYCSAIPSPVVESKGNAREEEGEGETCLTKQASTSCQPPKNGTILALQVQGDKDTDANIGISTAARGCPGLQAQNEAERKKELTGLLTMADSNGREARKAGLDKMTHDGNAYYKCVDCGVRKKRPRLLAHVLHEHLGLKTWVCPLCGKAYTARDDLSHHLAAIKVVCVCGKSLTRNNAYQHAKICKVCLKLGGRPKLECGRIVMEQVTALEAGTSVPNPPQNILSGEGPCAPLQKGSGLVGLPADKKRKALDDSGDDERKVKRVKYSGT